MIEFTIIEDNLKYINKYKEIIDKVMINYDINYTCVIHDKYRKELLNKDNFKIYIIKYSQELLKYIRETLDDWKSLIIVINKEEILLKDNLFILDCINRKKNYEDKLYRDIQICLKNYDQRPNSLKYTYKNILYSIEYQRIIYIEKELDNKRCIIKTIDRDYYIPGNLNKVFEMLDNRFIKCSRSFIVNSEQMSSYDTKENIIKFKNGMILDTVSRNNKKDIINYFRGICR